MSKIKIAPGEARGQESKKPADRLYPIPANQSRGNHNSSGLSVRELLGQEIVKILCYLQNQHLDRYEKAMSLSLLCSSLRRLVILYGGNAHG